MAKYVYDFVEGNKDLKDLLGGKGANLAEMTRMGLPVPPGFTITTEACREYLRTGSVPAGLFAEVEEHLRAVQAKLEKRLGDPRDPLLLSVRSGGKFSMPGMMETILDIGLNDSSVVGLAAQSGDERFAWDSYRRLIQMFGKTVFDVPGEDFEAALTAARHEAGVAHRRRAGRRGPAAPGRGVQEGLPRAHRAGLPAGPARAAVPGDHLGVLLLERRAGGAVPPAGTHPAGPRHRGQRDGHGLRQPRRRLRHRRGVHPRPGDRPARGLRRLPGERAGRGRGGRHPQHRRSARAGAHRPGRATTS